ncbi:MAG: hypothetical protein QOK42_1763 [Frankiaceae bacterium]|nr:hypothetical protein [Frankiaceae bacterium]
MRLAQPVITRHKPLVLIVGLTALCLPVTGLPVTATAAAPAVLRVGSWHGKAGSYTSVQAAVRAAKPGDWVLVGPGDYKENGYPGMKETAGVLITTPRVHLRGMDRNAVVIDGTVPGSAKCSAREADQRITKDGHNGVVAFGADGISIENLTACNYLTGTDGGEGNEIWFNGGDGTGHVGMGPFSGDYITGTSTYSKGTSNPRGEYGIFTSNSRGPGLIDHSYASNMGDSAYYIGACPDCNQVLRHAHGEFSALGYSGTNSGGRLIIEDSEFDNNKTGATTNSQNNDDAPSPQNGACPSGAQSPTGNGICNVWRNNSFHDNNNPNVPGVGEGLAGGAPVGTGLVFAGTENVAASHNRFANNGGWGIVVTDLPDQENPPTDIGQNCQGGTYTIPPGTPGQDPLCYYPAFGNAVMDNVFEHNGSFGNPTNGDIVLFHAPAFDPVGAPGNCVSGNTDSAGVTSDPPQVQSLPTYSDCASRSPNAGNPNPLVAAQLNCAGGILASCPNAPGATYPRTTTVSLHLPPAQLSMPNPCAGVPTNPWCPKSVAVKPPGKTGGGILAGTGLNAPLAVLGLSVLGLTLGLVATRRRKVPR